MSRAAATASTIAPPAGKRDTRVSVRDLARELDLSIATVSRALNAHPNVASETRARVLDAANSLSYRKPPRRRATSRVIALAYPGAPVTTYPGTFEASLMAGVLLGVSESHCGLSVVDIEHQRLEGESLREMLRRLGISGALLRTRHIGVKMAREFREAGVPSVVIADRSDDPDINFIYTDSRSDSSRVVDHLAAHGHTRIGLIIYRHNDADHRDREQGFVEGMHRNALHHDPSLVMRIAHASAEGGADALDMLLSLPDPPTAVFVTNPPATLGVLHRCLELGVRVPSDLSVVGFDDQADSSSPLRQTTRIMQDAVRLGQDAASWIGRHLAGEAPGPFHVVRQTTLAIHQTTGDPPTQPVRLAPDRRCVVRGPVA
ncbi:MAG: LacI family DNA-binding transcriptional regulator [Planctomycetota bacterium]